jgi:F-type H+-transporting ATPase subunit epsilon
MDHLLGRSLQCVVVTPERAVLDETADFVALPLLDGELGVLPGRAPLVGRLGAGALRIRRGQETKWFYVDGGFAQVRANVVTLLTQQAIRANAIDTASANRTLQEALPSTMTPSDKEAQRKKQQRARAQLRVARHAESG